MSTAASTERLVILELTLDDASYLLLLNSDPEVLRHVHDAPFVDLEAVCQWIIEIPQKLPNGFGRWAITLKDGTWIGRCSLRKGEDGVTLLGYRLLREHWGNGYATEAVRALRQLAFDRFRVTWLESHVAPGNAGSKRVLEKCGAQMVGKGPAMNFPDAEIYRFAAVIQ